MSELQAALLAIGLGVVLAVYVFGWWKQRQYSRKFGEAFRQSHDDALYQVKAEPLKTEPLRGATVAVAQPVAPELTLTEEAAMVNWDAMPVDAEIELPAIDATVAPLMPVERPADMSGETESSELAIPCTLLDSRCDFIIEIHPDMPCPAAALDGLWQRRGGLRKPVHVCGLTLNSVQWEKVDVDSTSYYSKFQVALQLVDRGGVISASALGDFREMVQEISRHLQADIHIPDLAVTHGNAQVLDAFCAEVDQMVGVNLLPEGERPFNAGKIAQAVALLGMKLEADGVFHLRDEAGHSVITLVNQDGRLFQPQTLAHFATAGLTLLLDVPRVAHPAASFDLLVQMAQSLARTLPAHLLDDHRVQLTEAALAHTRTQIAAVESKMCDNHLVPGSEQARRLFS